MIDNSTNPKCEVYIKYFEWGEPYQSFNPLFEIHGIDGNSQIEKSIHFFGKNNFKNQLLLLYNSILNFEEFRISNFDGIIINREGLLKLLDFYLEENKGKLSPWEKYSASLKENDFLENAGILLDFVLCFCYK
jgi:hypothetical protein